jgi:nucleoside-diphosphate-sugar epimerase
MSGSFFAQLGVGEKCMERPLAGSRILITGATGFVGTHLTEELLSQGAKVVALINDLNVNSLFHQKILKEGYSFTNYVVFHTIAPYSP